jgi:RNA polymerase sigma factor FliA
MPCTAAGQVVGRAAESGSTSVVVGGREGGLGRSAAGKLAREAPRASHAALWERYRSAADLEARALLVQQYIPLVYSVARQISVRLATVELDELVSAGNIGLLRALEAFDLSRGLAFTTYAVPRIRGAILDDLRQRDWMPRSARARIRRLLAARAELAARHQRTPSPAEVAAALGLELEVYWRWCDELDPAVRAHVEGSAGSVPDERGGASQEPAAPADQAPDHGLLETEKVAELRAAIGRLPERERRVLALCYFEELTMKQVGEVMGVTESRVCQIRQRALQRLRERLTSARRD